MAALATQADVEYVWRPLSTLHQQNTVVWLLDVASEVVRTEYPSIDDRITAGTIDAKVVAFVVASMVVRVVRNPDALRGESIGPHSKDFAVEALPDLSLTERERGLLTDTRRKKVGSLRTRPWTS